MRVGSGVILFQLAGFLTSALADFYFAKHIGNLEGNYSRRINIKHRLVYSVMENTDLLTDSNGELFEGIVFVKRMWTHYE